jgi:deoxyribonuclease V
MNSADVAAEFSVSRAREAQALISRKVINIDKLPQKINLVAGVDVAYQGNWAFGDVAVLDYETIKVQETQTATQKVKVPYVPTLFAFRELPAAVAAIRKLRLQPDVFLVDGHGRAHPYGCGLACHLGVALGKSNVGVAKCRLVGELKQVGKDVCWSIMTRLLVRLLPLGRMPSQFMSAWNT